MLGGGLWLSLRQEREGAADWQRTARTAVTVTLTYIFANFAISTAAENMTDNILRAEGVVGKRMVVANPVPLAVLAAGDAVAEWAQLRQRPLFIVHRRANRRARSVA